MSEERRLIKITIGCLLLAIVLFFSFMSYKGSKERSYSNVGSTIYIGDEYKQLAYKDKIELEEMLDSYFKKNNIKALFYIVRKAKHISSNGHLVKYIQVKENEVKLFLTILNPQVIVKYGKKLKEAINTVEFENFIALSILMQLNSDLYDTAIWDIHDYLNKVTQQ
ncbi:MAG: hypothetical protein HN353_10340 [Bdellovibrionales bacterium]|jgi:hypothetical protein|nr:hypothetical protein [Bdellovibrionales bacterium]MBT3527300.1 hypothetical protein [Bdellovibrionales bacterium]MBT7668825.1 hypothetical protein [Bdellovibrionales bacterium]MBT7768027.1 hypothetical protein [Bdellovibrionales bacterium]